MINVNINDVIESVDVASDTPLLWLLRDHLKLTGTKYGCGIGQCGACTVHLNGRAVRSCLVPVGSIASQKVETIESEFHVEKKALQQAWHDLNVPQCGYCQSGQIMSASALLADNNDPSIDEIDQFMSGNICRCATYERIRAGIKQAAQQLQMKQGSGNEK